MTKKLETLAIHAGHQLDEATGAVTPPIHLSTTFERAPDGGYPRGFSYTRSDNPTRRALERTLATIEGGADCVAFSSGSAAASAIFKSLGAGAQVLIPTEMYHGLRTLIREGLEPWGLQVSAVDMTDLGAVREALRNDTRLVWVETPSNPRLMLTDIAGVVGLARSVGAWVACDNTWTPPPLQPVFDLGVDLVMHATTKYLAGHSDVLGGAVIAREGGALCERVRFWQQTEGAVPSPFECWLTLRGVKTLPYRMRGHCENAMKLAEWLNAHPKVARVHYPGLETHSQHPLATKQMQAYGGMLSFEVAGSEADAMKVTANVELFTRATSLGGVESLIEHRASIEGPGTPTPDTLLRISVGLEHPDDLIADLEQALGAI